VLFLSNEKTEHTGKVFLRESKFLAGHEKGGKCRRSRLQAKCPYVLQVDQNSIRYWLYMRVLFAILGLLLFLIATRADELLMIKDSEAVQYVGKNAEVRGLVFSVTTIPLGTACISFGREYPDQTFAAFIAVGSEMETDQRIATLQGNIIGITGTIELHQGKPAIKITSGDQIKGVNFSTGAGNQVSQ
jgi:hypothetical protein